MPKAQAAFGASDGEDENENEKTTIESGWDEEPSTTIAQSEVAEQIRSLGPERRGNGTNVTSTGILDEPTVDDQRANAALSLLTPPLNARLMITGGNDSGQELAVLPGKSYTIGRAVDNDVVLTDIAVSRKHFDLKFEAGAWVLVDRGSGNGTLVNGNLEDHPFMLANGDQIEIGNTTFRFELPNGMPRAVGSSMDSVDQSMDGGMGSMDRGMDDEEEPSTVAGKPIRADEIATPSHLPAHARPKTLPPPAPLVRARNPSSGPPMGYAAPTPASTLPMPPLQGRPIGPQSPTMLGDQMGVMPGAIPTTLPGQGHPSQPLSQQMGPPMGMYNNGYPQSVDLPPQHARALVINGGGGRDAPPTALVPPTPYNGMPAVHMPSQPYGVAQPQPQISRRTKLILGGAALTLLAAIATVAIIKGGEPKPTTTTPQNTVKDTGSSSATNKPVVSPIDDPKKDPPKATVTAIDTGTKVPPKTDPPKTDPAKIQLPRTVTLVEPPKVDPPKVDPPKVEPPKVEPPKVDPPKVDPPKIAKVDPPKVDPPKKDPVPPKKDPKKDKKKDKKVVVRNDPPAETPTETPTETPKKDKRVATDTSGVKAKADGLYRSKNFAGAASALRAAVPGAGPEDVRELKSLAAVYEQFGRNYNVGMAPGTGAKEAYEKLNTALGFDNSAGNAFTSDINARIAELAPKAAAAYTADKDWVRARNAVKVAEQGGKGNSTTQGVKSKLESEAGKLFKEAQAEQATSPASAKEKFKQIQRMVDSKSQWFQRASKALSGG